MNQNVRNLIFLAAGVAITVLFMIFPTQIYEAVRYFEGGYSNELYNYGIYDTFAMITAGIAWAVALIYYYVINSVRFDRWPHWLIMLLVAIILVPAACFSYNEYVFSENGLAYLGESLQMSVFHVLFGAVMFVVASFAARWWSTNCRHSPF